MTTINLTDPQNNTLADANLIAPNNALLETAINGQLDNGNIASGANIDGAKLLAASISQLKLANPSICVLTKTSDQSIPNGGTTLTFSTALKDTDTMADIANNRIVIKTAGFYYVVASIGWDDGGAGFWKGTLLRLNGATLGTGNYVPTQTAAFNGQPTVVQAYLQLIVNDNLGIFANQNTGGNVQARGNNNNGFQTFLSAQRICA